MTEIPKNSAVPEVKMPKIPSNSPMAAKSLNLGKLSSKKAQLNYLNQRRKLPAYILFLKYVSILGLCAVGGAYFWLQADLDPQNQYLHLVGLKENTYKKFESVDLKNKKLSAEKVKAETDIKKYEDKIQNKEYYEYQDKINKIRADQSMQWFDEIDNDGNLKLGIFDSFEKMENYFKDDNYTQGKTNDGKISGQQLLRKNSIEIENILIDRNHVSFSVKTNNLYRKVFFLSSEFVEMMNSFSFFKNGSINSYSRQGADKDNMSFTLDLKIQAEDEIDPADEKFAEYEDWLSGNFDIDELDTLDDDIPTVRTRTRPKKKQ